MCHCGVLGCCRVVWGGGGGEGSVGLSPWGVRDALGPHPVVGGELGGGSRALPWGGWRGAGWGGGCTVGLSGAGAPARLRMLRMDAGLP